MKRSTRRQTDDPRRELAKAGGPDLEQLREEFEFTLNERDSSLFTRARLNHDARYCVWPGQSQDGRKWKVNAGEDEVFPWPGASDARVALIDLYIKKHVAFLMVLDQRMKSQVNGTEVNDEAWAARLSNVLRWMKTTQMRERRMENQLLANYLLERGSAVQSVLWVKQRQLGYQELDRETLLNLAVQQAQQNAGDPATAQAWLELPQRLYDPGSAAALAALLQPLFPDVPSKRLEQVLADVRLTGYARFPMPTVIANRPRVMSYCPNEDIFVSPDAQHGLEDASLFTVQVMREAQLRAQAADYGWNKEWTEEVIATQRGNVEFAGLQFNQRLSRQASLLVPNRGQLDTRKLYLVVHAYRRLADEEGVPGIFYTCFHPHLTGSYAAHELLNYDHGKTPFVLFTQEVRSRRIDDSRGYGEIASTWQNQIKAEWDNRIDRASIGTLPPSHYPPGQQPDKWGPGVQVPTNNPDGFGFFEPAGEAVSSREVQETVREFADEYFAESSAPDKLPDMQVMKQKLADDWMDGHTNVDTMIVQLCQQFMPDNFYYRVVGSAKAKPIHASREEIQGQFDISAGYDVANFNPEQRKERMGLMEMALSIDVNNIVDRDEALVVAFEMVDPNLGERLLKPAESASLQEKDDEQTVALKLLMGQTVPVKPGQAYQLRMNTLAEFIQTSTEAQRLLKANPQAQAAVMQRMKDLEFQIQQQQNAVTGRGGPAFLPKTVSK